MVPVEAGSIKTIDAYTQKPDWWKYLIVQVEAGFMEKIIVWAEEELIKLFNNESRSGIDKAIYIFELLLKHW